MEKQGYVHAKNVAWFFFNLLKTFFIIDPRNKKDIVLRVFPRRSNPTNTIEEGAYYLKGTLSFTTYYFPQAFKAALIKKWLYNLR